MDLNEVVAYGHEVVARLQDVLGDGLRGACFVGSIPLGGCVAGESDVDIVALSEHGIGRLLT